MPVGKDRAGLAVSSWPTSLTEDLAAWTTGSAPASSAFRLPSGQNRTTAQAMRQAFGTAVAHLATKLGGAPSSWRWGRLHTRQFPSLTGADALGYGPRASSGDAWTVNAAEGGLHSSVGPVLADGGGVCRGPWPGRGRGRVPGRPEREPASPWYDDLISRWWSDQVLPMITPGRPAGSAALDPGRRHQHGSAGQWADLRGSASGERAGSSSGTALFRWWLVIVLPGRSSSRAGPNSVCVRAVWSSAVGPLLARPGRRLASHPARRAGHCPARLGCAAVLARGRPGAAGGGHRRAHRGSAGVPPHAVFGVVSVAGGRAASRRRLVAGPRADATRPIPLTPNSALARCAVPRSAPGRDGFDVRPKFVTTLGRPAGRVLFSPSRRRSCAVPSVGWRVWSWCRVSPAVGAHRLGSFCLWVVWWSCGGQPEPSASTMLFLPWVAGVVWVSGQPEPSARIVCLLLLVGGVVVGVAVSPAVALMCCSFPVVSRRVWSCGRSARAVGAHRVSFCLWVVWWSVWRSAPAVGAHVLFLPWVGGCGRGWRSAPGVSAHAVLLWWARSVVVLVASKSAPAVSGHGSLPP